MAEIVYKSYIEKAPPEVAANTLVCLIHQTNYLLDRQLRVFEKGIRGGRRFYRAVVSHSFAGEKKETLDR
ncbi:MAG: hypothetical protein JEZ11_05250 [Desulfobacterales bacterium]|nr:hypothetical protein [Desulfobacterales bacterium]